MNDYPTDVRLRIITSKNETFIAYVDDPHSSSYDNIGALYYVVAVVFIYALSIVMMIASHIRKNKQDSQLRVYLKEMALLRKKDRREKLFEKMSDIANKAKPKANDSTTNNSGNGKQKDQEAGMDVDDDSSDLLLSKNNYNDNDDSVFHLPGEYCMDGSKESPPQRSLWKNDGRPFVHIQVINENVPL
ncbi:hypothetical protein ACJMK2_041945 [Sinanodonta woodiana]|uniref:Uncharacterized protein n=1 Tax=Sinanodonta woodiana TaxID=1069815 RepID=A0ABD3W7M8_SINWO